MQRRGSGEPQEVWGSLAQRVHLVQPAPRVAWWGPWCTDPGGGLAGILVPIFQMGMQKLSVRGAGQAHRPQAGQGQCRTRAPDPIDRLSKKAAPGNAGSQLCFLFPLLLGALGVMVERLHSRIFAA